MTAEALREYLHREIPLSRALELDVDDPGPERVVLSAPLAPNTNHRDTAFGGSVSALATLAGWALVHRRLHRTGRSVQVVIQRGAIDYLQPISGPFRAVCDGIADREWRRLSGALDRSGKGRARVDVRVDAGGEVVARFEGAYVAIRREP